jgi:hypothetical protein
MAVVAFSGYSSTLERPLSVEELRNPFILERPPYWEKIRNPFILELRGEESLRYWSGRFLG